MTVGTITSWLVVLIHAILIHVNPSFLISYRFCKVEPSILQFYYNLTLCLFCEETKKSA